MAHLAGILASQGEAAPYGVGIRALEREVVGQSVGVGQGEVVVVVEFEPAAGRLPVHAGVDAPPAQIYLPHGSIHQRLRLQSQQTTKVLGSLQVASHPVEALCAA